MEALENVIMEEGDVVTIPEDIDSEQHNISLEVMKNLSQYVCRWCTQLYCCF